MASVDASIYDALLAVQKNAPALQKNAINPHFKSKYLSLDALMEQILPILNEHGLVLIQTPTFEYVGNGIEPMLQTTLYYPATQTFIESSMPLMLDKETPQGQGSAITYARRYALMAILGLVADQDDDGNAASGRAKGTTNVRSDNQSGASEDLAASLGGGGAAF